LAPGGAESATVDTFADTETTMAYAAAAPSAPACGIANAALVDASTP